MPETRGFECTPYMGFVFEPVPECPIEGTSGVARNAQTTRTAKISRINFFLEAENFTILRKSLRRFKSYFFPPTVLEITDNSLPIPFIGSLPIPPFLSLFIEV
jgi:hypothetical protein